MKVFIQVTCCFLFSFILLAVSLSIFALTGATPFGEFLELIAQYEENPSGFFSDDDYFDKFQGALAFFRYFVVSPIIIITGFLGAAIGKDKEFIVGILPILPMAFIYVIPVISIGNIFLAFFCIIFVVLFIIFIRNKRKGQGGEPLPGSFTT